jgi:hypothetical protein
MVRFLSADWVDAMAEAARTVAPEAGLGNDVVFEQVVRTQAGAERRWHLIIGPLGLRVADGAAVEPVITLFTDELTAGQIARGELNAQRALDAGALKVRGDLEAAAAVRGALNALDDVFAAVRGATEWT